MAVGALGHDLTVIEYQDLVGVQHRANALGNDKTVRSFMIVFEGGLDLGLGFDIHGAGAVRQVSGSLV